MTIFGSVLLLILSTSIWYGFFYYLLYSIKRDVNLHQSALILLVLLSLGLLTCPFFLNWTGFIVVDVNQVLNLLGR